MNKTYYIVPEFVEKAVYRLAIWFLKRGYGADCPDLDENWMHQGGCPSCQARKVIDFLEDTINQ